MCTPFRFMYIFVLQFDSDWYLVDFGLVGRGCEGNPRPDYQLEREREGGEIYTYERR